MKKWKMKNKNDGYRIRYMHVPFSTSPRINMQNWQIFSVCHCFVKQPVSYILCYKDSCLQMSYLSNLHVDVSVVFRAYPL